MRKWNFQNAGRVCYVWTDIDGLYDKDPHKDEDARIIPVVEEITEHLFEIAGGKGSKFGTGGMITKLFAAKLKHSCH